MLYFVCFVFPMMMQLGINVDEGCPGIIALDIISQFTDKLSYRFDILNPLFEQAGVSYFSFNDIYIPVKFCSYEGTVGICLTSVLLVCSESLIFALRFPYLVFALIIFVAVYFTLKEVFDKNTAVLAVLFLATNSVFMQAVVVANLKDEIHQIAFFFLGMMFFVRSFFNKKKGLFYLGLGSFFWGIGLMAKFMFFGFLGPFFLIVLLSKQLRRFFKKKEVLICFSVCFLLGFLPVAINYLDEGLFSFGSFLKCLSGKTDFHDNSNILTNLLIRYSDFASFLQQEISLFIRQEEMLSLVNYYSRNLFLIGVLYFIVKRNYTVFYIIFFYSVLWFLTIFVPFLRVPSHMVILFPFVELIQAYFIVSIYRDPAIKMRYKKYIVGLLLLICICFFGNNIKNNFTLFNYVQKNQVQQRWTNLIYPVCDYLVEEGITEIYSASEVFNPKSVDFLTKRQVRAYSFWYDYWFLRDYYSLESLRSWFENSDSSPYRHDSNIFYVILNDNYLKRNEKPQSSLFEIITSKNKSVERIKTFSDEYDSISIYRVIRR